MKTTASAQTHQQANSTEPVIITKRAHDILLAVNDYRFVDLDDITHLFFAPTSRKYVGKLLFRLSGKQDDLPHQYLYRFSLPDTKRGTPKKIYTLGSKGAVYLRHMGRTVPWQHKPTRIQERSHGYLLHPLTLTKVLIALTQAVKTMPDLALPVSKTEYELKRELTRLPATITTTAGKTNFRYAAIPDAWLDFERCKDGKHQAWKPVWLEIDCDTEGEAALTAQISARIDCVKPNGLYKQLFGTNAVTIAYVTTGNQTRLQHMLGWTEEVLKKRNKKHKASLFRFCRLDHGALAGAMLLQEAIWSQPFVKRPVTLLG
jgi:hypothetical protein